MPPTEHRAPRSNPRVAFSLPQVADACRARAAVSLVQHSSHGAATVETLAAPRRGGAFSWDGVQGAGGSTARDSRPLKIGGERQTRDDYSGNRSAAVWNEQLRAGGRTVRDGAFALCLIAKRETSKWLPRGERDASGLLCGGVEQLVAREVHTLEVVRSSRTPASSPESVAHLLAVHRSASRQNGATRSHGASGARGWPAVPTVSEGRATAIAGPDFSHTHGRGRATPSSQNTRLPCRRDGALPPAVTLPRRGAA